MSSTKMEVAKKTGLKKDVLDRIVDDPVLFGKVCVLIGVGVLTGYRVIPANDSRLTQIEVLEVVARHIGVKNIKDLLDR